MPCQKFLRQIEGVAPMRPLFICLSLDDIEERLRRIEEALTDGQHRLVSEKQANLFRRSSPEIALHYS